MKRLSWKMAVATLMAIAFFESTAWAADRVSGLITQTYVMVQDTDLVGDVTCDVENNPCFSFGAPDIVLKLNGFTVTGKADPVTGCRGATFPREFGITTNGHSNVEIRGPGLVQQFRNFGVFVTGSTNARVLSLTASTNCASGIFVPATSFGTLVHGNIAVRNGSSAPGFTCGGI